MHPAGLRRFVGAPDGSPAAPAVDAVEICEMCATPLASGHSHVVDVEQRSLRCTCRACYLLFVPDRAGDGRYRAVPDRYLHDPRRPLTAVEWERLGIPVGSAFFLRGADGLRGFYPSPAGATECLLDLDAWADLAAGHPLLEAAALDVEAILIRNRDDTVEHYLVPIDACYELVGTVRKYWKGFDGGQEAREHIEEFFAGIRSRTRTFAVDRHD